MAPIKGGIIKKRKKVDQNVAVSAGFSLLYPPQPLDWWDEFSGRIFGSGPGSEGSQRFELVFKISRKTFDYICSLVEEEMKTKQLNFSFSNGEPLSLKDMVAVAIRRLSSGESLAIVGDLFGLNQSSVSQITWRFVEAMEEKALHHLQWPSTECEMDKIKSKFEKIRGLRNCCGAIDITHIIMNIPAVDPSHHVWIDRENNYSMLLQAVVDPDMRFRDIITGWPGSFSDSAVLQSSGFFQLCKEGEILNGKIVNLSGDTEVREYIIGDAGFPLLSWLITPYKGKELSDVEVEFNKRLSVTRMVAQRALARLKEMWLVIKGVMWMPDKNKLPRIILVCCLLHNIVIDMEDDVVDDMPLAYNHDRGYGQQRCGSVDEAASEMREKLSLYLSRKLPSDN